MNYLNFNNVQFSKINKKCLNIKINNKNAVLSEEEIIEFIKYLNDNFVNKNIIEKPSIFHQQFQEKLELLGRAEKESEERHIKESKGFLYKIMKIIGRPAIP